MRVVALGATKLASDGVVAALARRQHGIVARRQLLAAGVTGGAVKRRTESGLLVPVHRGVYALGGRPRTRAAHFMAAVLAAGEASAVSHISAAHLRRLLEGETARIHVTTPARAGRRAGLVVHHCAPWQPGERTEANGIPCTSVARTLVDLAATEPRRRVEKAVEQAEILQVFDGRELAPLMRRRAGTEALRAVLDRFGTSTMTRSDLEEAFLSLIRDAGVPQPECNVGVALGDGRFKEVDALWRAERVAVELDGGRYHRTGAAYHRDRATSAELIAVRIWPLRFSDLQIERRPAWVLEMVRRALA